MKRNNQTIHPVSRKKQKIQEVENNANDTNLILALFNTNILQNLFSKLVELYEQDIRKKLNHKSDFEDNEQCYEKRFSKMHNFKLVCKTFFNISKITLFNLDIYPINFQIPYDIYIKLDFIKKEVEEDIFYKYEKKNTEAVLIFSCKEGFYDVIHTLIREGNMDVNLNYGYNNITPLLAAIKKHKIKTIKELFKYNNLDINTEGLLNQIFQRNNKDIINLFLSRPDLDINKLDSEEGMTILMSQVKAKKKNAVALLLARPDLDLNIQDDNGLTALRIATLLQQENIISLLLSRNDLDLNMQDDSGVTSLMEAVGLNNESIVSLFLWRPDLDLNIQDNNSWTVLLYAAWENYENIVSLLLLRNDIDFNVQDNQGASALLWAISNNHENIVSLFLSRNEVDVNIQDNYGYSSLTLAIERNQHKTVSLLLRRNDLELSHRLNHHLILLEYAITEHQETMVSLLL